MRTPFARKPDWLVVANSSPWDSETQMIVVWVVALVATAVLDQVYVEMEQFVAAHWTVRHAKESVMDR